MRKTTLLLVIALLLIIHTLPAQALDSIRISDLYRLRSVADPQLSSDGAYLAFSVSHADRPGFPYTRIKIASLSGLKLSDTVTSGGFEGTSPRWSPDGSRIAFLGTLPGGEPGIIVVNKDGTGAQKLADYQTSNHPWPMVGNRLAWSPDGKRLAFVSATPGPEPDMNADPIVITRYWFRPATSAGGRFSDNRRLHIFLVDVASRQVQQLTKGETSEHSINWSPDGRQLVFLSNHEPDPDFVFNYDIFTLDVSSGTTRQLTQTKNNEFAPVWSPDGKTIAYSGLKRDITSSETNMEDTHVWTIDAASGARHELGAGIDNRQGAPLWSPDGQWLYFTVQSGGSTTLHRIRSSGEGDEVVARPPDGRGDVSGFAVTRDGSVIACMSSAGDLPQLYLTQAGKNKALTAFNASLLAKKRIAPVEAFTFRSVDGLPVEAFLTLPAGGASPAKAAGSARFPLIVMIHGGPHGQQGPAFNHRAQVYAAHGYATLMVNYRGSTGYGQTFSNAIAYDQNGKEAIDVLVAIDSVLARYPSIDAKRLGVEGQSYGGQLTNWLVTQTDRFSAAIPAASISNLVSHNYMSVYHDYLQQEYDVKPHLRGVVDSLWMRSAIRIVYKVHTPVMFIHGDNDQLVNPAEIEQFYIGLKDVGVETKMVRYPREGHGIRESRHLEDIIGRSIAWYDAHFAGR
jgi:dipeptidyl aminopeptidase/acylaminoacyl peptidase